MTDPVNPADMGQTEYMKLFMQELTYQDPLKPVDNREFMAQMAQFSAVQQTAEMNTKLGSMINLMYGNFATSLFNARKNLYVSIADAEGAHQIKGMRFDSEGNAQLRIELEKGGDDPWVNINQITELSPQGDNYYD